MALPLSGFTASKYLRLLRAAMGSLLQDLGADIVKIEPPVSGDPSRHVSPWGFLNYKSGKEKRLAQLEIENGTRDSPSLNQEKKSGHLHREPGPNVAGRLGISYETLSELNSGLIYCSIKGFSKKSRDYDRPAFDAVAQAMSGIMSLTGEPDGEPVRVGNPSTDLGSCRLWDDPSPRRDPRAAESNKGKFIEVSLLDMSVYWNGYWLTYFGMTGKLPQRLDPVSGICAPQGVQN